MTASLLESEAGVREVPFGGMPHSYARQLAYLGNASTIRMRVLERFGSSPSVSQIEKYIAERNRLRSEYRSASDRLAPVSSDGFAFRVQSPLRKRDQGMPIGEVAANDDKQTTEPESSEPPMLRSDIVAAVASRFGVTLADIRSGSRKLQFSIPRRTAIYVLCMRGASTSAAASMCGLRDHTSAIYAIRQFELHATPEMRAIAAEFIGERGPRGSAKP